MSEGDTQACFRIALFPQTPDETFAQELILAKASLVIDRSCPPQTAALGDRVWEDLDGDGVQDCEDSNGNGQLGDAADAGSECAGAGLADVPVELFETDDAGECTVPTGASTVTDNEGFYLFEDLDPGDYCVRFDIGGLDALCQTNGISLGVPVFTKQNIGGEDLDSDASISALTWLGVSGLTR